MLMSLISRGLDVTVPLLQRSRIQPMLGRALDHAPRRVQSWARAENRKRLALVPERELEAKYREALLTLRNRGGDASIGDYLEFGVYHGASLACMYRVLSSVGLNHVRLFGFDSFEGLPEKEAADVALPWHPGQFSAQIDFTRAQLTRAGVDWSRVFLVKGWYRDTLNDDLIRLYDIRKASIIMIDCDLYSSAKEALTFCAPLIRDDAVIFLDDWHSGVDLAGKDIGEKRAFDEFLKENPDLTAEEFGTYYHTELSPPVPSKVFLVSRQRPPS